VVSNKIKVGINGFGRFGQHLLIYWLKNYHLCNYEISYINDDFLNEEKIIDIIINDKKLFEPIYNFDLNNNILKITTDEIKHQILITNSSSENINWIGLPRFFLECSGKNTDAKNCKKFLKNNTRNVFISATSPSADKTIVYGFNHKQKINENEIISYGSCTVNAFVVFANYINYNYEIINSDVNVIHNVPKYQLKEFDTLKRKFCTLEKSGPLLLDFLNNNNFKVNYTLIPYSGVSIIDFRFQVRESVIKDDFIQKLEEDLNKDILSSLYSIKIKDEGPEFHKNTDKSAVFIRNNIEILGNNIYVHSYFDNENSVNRYHDLINYFSLT
tara:strand:+ start:3050 stop:4036 length:987 start_codon:yes stop_codon:yes gene_type:complete